MDYRWFYKGTNWNKRRRETWKKIEKLNLPHRIKPNQLKNYPVLDILEMLRISVHPVEGMIRGINRGDVLCFLSDNTDKILSALNACETTEFRNLHTGSITTIADLRNDDFGAFYKDLATFFEHYEVHRGYNKPLFEYLERELDYAEKQQKKNSNKIYTDDFFASNNVFYSIRDKYKKVEYKRYINALKVEIDKVLKEAPEEIRRSYYKETETEDLFRFFDVAM